MVQKSDVHEHFQHWVHARVFTGIFRLYAHEYQERISLPWEWQAMVGTLLQPLCTANRFAWGWKDWEKIHRTGGAAATNSISISSNRESP